MLKLSSSAWCQRTGVIVYDADGWDRSAERFKEDWDRPITFDEWYEKATRSTCLNLLEYEELKRKINL